MTPEEHQVIQDKMKVIYETVVRPQIKAYEDAKKAGTLKPLPFDYYNPYLKSSLP